MKFRRVILRAAARRAAQSNGRPIRWNMRELAGPVRQRWQRLLAYRGGYAELYFRSERQRRGWLERAACARPIEPWFPKLRPSEVLRLTAPPAGKVESVAARPGGRAPSRAFWWALGGAVVVALVAVAVVASYAAPGASSSTPAAEVAAGAVILAVLVFAACVRHAIRKEVVYGDSRSIRRRGGHH